ncbi:MAG: sulfatase-like hydrolase/transferase [Thermoanaerobaculales bacterium]|nr:sulfatase-like hydrolase/transferase [Thermoanaerobaculales bacterium]
MRRTLTRILLPAVLAAGGCAPREGSAPPPDVVLITVDALRADVLSFAGYPRPTSPQLDALAAEGVAFTQALTSFPGTSPAMPSLMSGLYPSFEGVEAWTKTSRHGFNELESPEESEREGLSDTLVMLAEVLGAAGYTTLGFNTNPHLDTSTNFHQGFAEYEQFLPYLNEVRSSRPHPLLGAYPPADVVVSAVLRRLDRGHDRPVFLWLHLMDSHSPYLPPERFASLFRPPGATLTDLEINESLYHLLYRQQGSLRAAERYPSPEARGLSREEFMTHLRALYAAEVRFADDELGRLFAGLRARSLWRDALVLVTADHGEELLDHGFVAHHELTGLAEELVRIPAILKPPGAGPAARQITELVRMVDFAPTILDYAGLAGAAGSMDGLSLRPLVEGRPMAPLTAFFSTVRYGVARDARWKYRLEKRPQGGGAPVERLFDIAADPQERDDLAARHPEVVDEMRARYLDFVRRLNARVAAGPASATGAGGVVDDAERDRLEALGYLQ